MPRQAAVANDHFVFTGKKDDDKQTAIGAQFAKFHGIEKPYYANPGDGIFHFYFPEQGLVLPGQFIPGADSHSRAYGAYGAVGMRCEHPSMSASGTKPTSNPGNNVFRKALVFCWLASGRAAACGNQHQ